MTFSYTPNHSSCQQPAALCLAGLTAMTPIQAKANNETMPPLLRVAHSGVAQPSSLFILAILNLHAGDTALQQSIRPSQHTSFQERSSAAHMHTGC
jgi:hypothetical protein